MASSVLGTKQAKLCPTTYKIFPFLSDLDIKELQAFLCRKIDNTVVYTVPRWIPPQALCKPLWSVMSHVPHRGHGSAWRQDGGGMVSSWVQTNMCTGVLTLVPVVFQNRTLEEFWMGEGKPSTISGICSLNGRDTFYPCLTTKRISWCHLETINSNPWSLMTMTLRSSKSVVLMSMILKQLFSRCWHRQLPRLPRLKTHGAEPASCCSSFLQQSWRE